jgi:pimeloyl-ACP methyl ester carboxylesterase
VSAIQTGLDRIVECAPYVLVGFSFGASVAVRLAEAHDDRIRKIILVSPGGFGSRASVELEGWRHLTEPLERDAVHRRNLERLMFADGSSIDSLAVFIQRRNAERGRVRPRSLRWSTSILDVLASLHVPVAAIFGDSDATHALGVEERIAQLRTVAPTADVQVVQSAGHWVQYEAANAFNRALRILLTPPDGGA